MTDVSAIIEVLEKDDALQLGASPWDPDLNEDDWDTHQVDWDRLFPANRPSRDPGSDFDWDIWGDEWVIPDETLDSLFGEVERAAREPDRVVEHGWDTCAWYHPIHFHGYDWGIFVREDCMRRLAGQIYGRVGAGKAAFSVPLVKALLRTAFLAYYRHELFHHKTECLGLRLHAVEGKSSYLPYFRFVYQPTSGTDDQLEEALANAYMYRDLAGQAWVPSSLVRAARDHLEATFPYDPPGYRLAPKYLKRRDFDAGQHYLFSQVHQGVQNPKQKDWILAPRMNQSFFNIKSDIWTVVPRGRRSVLPTTATPVRTCSSQDMVRVCEQKGYREVSGGKGSHIKLKKDGHPTIVIPGNRKNLSPGSAKNVLEALGGYKLNDLQTLF